jgi:iron-sulfur cluster assembly accessory protein
MIQLSPTAIDEVKRLQKKHAPTGGSWLRIQVNASGCKGLAYQMQFVPSVPQPTDQVFACEAVQVVIDSVSLNYLSGLTLDYTEDLMGGGFRFYNPNAVETCNCGHSFATTV